MDISKIGYFTEQSVKCQKNTLTYVSFFDAFANYIFDYTPCRTYHTLTFPIPPPLPPHGTSCALKGLASGRKSADKHCITPCR